MKPKQLLNDYLSGSISGEELRALLANDKSREARRALEILHIDAMGRKALEEFSPHPGAAERLAEKVAAVETWMKAQAHERSPSRNWFTRLVPAMDVVGHSHSERTKKRRKKSKATKKARSKAKSPPRAKNTK